MPSFDLMSQDIRGAAVGPAGALTLAALFLLAPTIAQAGERELVNLTGHWWAMREIL